MVPHDAAAEAVVALAREALAPQEAGVAGALVRHVLALGVDAFNEQFYGTHVVAGHQHPRRLLQALPYQRERQRRRRFAEICASRLLLAVVRVEVQVTAWLTHSVSWKSLSCTKLDLACIVTKANPWIRRVVLGFLSRPGMLPMVTAGAC